MEHQEEGLFWKEKYEELRRRWESCRGKEGKELEVALGKMAAL